MIASPRITLEQWQALVAIVDAGSYEAAARAVSKSQSALSYAIQRIEHLLGVQVFERSAVSLSAGWEAEIRIACEVVFPSVLLLDSLDRFGRESPHTRIEVVESVLAGTSEALTTRNADLAIAGMVPAGFVGEPLARLRLVLAASPSHPLHQLGRPVTLRDLKRNRQLVVRESDSKRATRVTFEATQRWTVSHVATSVTAATLGFGYGWYPDERIRRELEAGTLRPLPLAEGGDRYAELYLVFGDRENAGPGVLRLAQLVRERVAECPEEARARPVATGRASRR